MTKRRPTVQRGYGQAHRAEKRRLERILEQDGTLTCVLCGGPIVHGIHTVEPDHNPDDPTRTTYRGPAHRHCNRSEGAKRGNANRTTTPTRLTLRQW